MSRVYTDELSVSVNVPIELFSSPKPLRNAWIQPIVLPFRTGAASRLRTNATAHSRNKPDASAKQDYLLSYTISAIHLSKLRLSKIRKHVCVYRRRLCTRRSAHLFLPVIFVNNFFQPYDFKINCPEFTRGQLHLLDCWRNGHAYFVSTVLFEEPLYEGFVCSDTRVKHPLLIATLENYVNFFAKQTIFLSNKLDEGSPSAPG